MRDHTNRKISSRERVLAALSHEEPDRVPFDLGGLVTTIQKTPYASLKKYLEIKSDTKVIVRENVDPPAELLDRFSIDTRYIRLKPPKNWKFILEPDNSYVDEWGVRWQKPKGSLYWDPVYSPLKNATLDDLDNYPWPDPDDPGRFEGLKEEAKKLHNTTDFAIVADTVGWGIFEFAWVALRGPGFLTDLIMDKSFATALLDKMTEIYLRLYRNYLDAVGEYIDVIMVMDDLGGQNGPLISLEMYRELIKPIHKRQWKFIKENTDARLFLHSCGSVIQFIPDLIELGVDILNPVQVSAKGMNTSVLKSRFGDKITFWGGIDTQQILPMGSADDVELEVKRRIADLAPGGGYVLTAVHNIQAGVKPENIVAMYDSGLKYGKYPLNL